MTELIPTVENLNLSEFTEFYRSDQSSLSGDPLDGYLIVYIGNKKYMLHDNVVTAYDPQPGDDYDQLWITADGVPHRDGGPAKSFRGGRQIYYQHGVIGRPENLPSVIDPEERRWDWYQDGKAILMVAIGDNNRKILVSDLVAAGGRVNADLEFAEEPME